MTYTNVVFAGGGNRCFWQAGFWEVFAKEHDIQPKTIASVSAGSAISCAIFAGRIQETLENTIETQSQNKKNRYWENLLSNRPVHPHSELYRHIVYKSLDDAALQQLRSGPENRILLAHLPPWLGPRSGVLVGMLSYQLEKHLMQPVHPRLGRKIGFKSEFVPVQEATTVEALANIILSSSCTPPFTPLMYRDNKPVLDGGMVDNVPLHGVDSTKDRTLVLLSRPYKRLPDNPNVDYVQPLSSVPIKSWDYTNPALVRATYKQGRKDAEHYLSHFNVNNRSMRTAEV